MKNILLILSLSMTLTACAQQNDNNASAMNNNNDPVALQSAQKPKVTDGVVNVINQDEFALLVNEWRQTSTWEFKGDRPAIIDFNATWCGPCRKLKPILDQLAKEYSGKIDFYSIDVDENRPLAMWFRISSIPMLLICPVDGKPQALVGMSPKENIVEAIREVAKVK